MFSFKITVDSHAVVRNNIERSGVTFIHFPPVVTSCKTIVRYYSLDIDIDTIMIQNISITNILHVTIL